MNSADDAPRVLARLHETHALAHEIAGELASAGMSAVGELQHLLIDVSEMIDCSGIGNGLGAPSSSHASVQAERSWRQNFPVRDFDRIVLRDVAASSFSLTTGDVSASGVVSQTEPVHAPAAPIAMHAAICRPVTIPPAARTGIELPMD
jgi:hypothetical protein